MTNAPASRHSHHPGLRCFDDRCRLRETCPLWQDRQLPAQGPVAATWRRGYECQDQICAKAQQATGAVPPAAEEA